jgi:hypothetical protein
VDNWCSSQRPHAPNCEYFLAGGLPQGEGLAEGGVVNSIRALQPGASQGPITGDIEHDVSAALAHGGAGMLFGKPNSSYFGAFGSGDPSSKLAALHGGEEAANAANYLGKVTKGRKAMQKGVDSLFGNDSFEAPEATDKVKQSIKDYVENGGVDAELGEQDKPTTMMAEGGEIGAGKEDPLSSMFPTHGIMLNAAKARVSNYLNGLRAPGIQQKLPFDANKSTRRQDSEYDKAVDLAASPLKILSKVKDGSLTPNTLKHFGTMYPELHNQLSKKMTEGVLKAQLADERPAYKTRQAMSMFLGSALDSTMTPASIQAAQGIFAQKNAQQQAQAPVKNKKGTSTLSKVSENYQTADQASQARQRQ